jgi:AcrR family transcriptional regulator
LPVSERLDARENRRKLLKAARAAIARRGLEVSALEIADAAGVGVGTLYRRFGTKESLLDAVVLAEYDEIVDQANECKKIADPWEGFSTFLFTLSEAHRESRGLAEVTAACDRPPSAAMTQRVETLQQAVKELTDAAHASGSLRTDVSWKDVLLCSRAALDVDHCLGVDAGPDGWRRTISLLLDGMRASK